MAHEDPPPRFSASEARAAVDGPSHHRDDSRGSLPPGYSDDNARPRRKTPPAALTEHVFTLGAEKKQHPWAVLKIRSRTKAAAKTPVFVQGDRIAGALELDLEKTEHIEAVTIQVRGETWSGQSWAPELEGTIPFWSQTTTLRSTSVGDPSNAAAAGGSAKLKGKYTWPFSIRLPKKALDNEILDGPVDFELPPSFSERGSPIYIDYKIIVTFSRGRLRIDHNLIAPFVYLPVTRPAEPSLLRQLAYREKWLPPGPQKDPAGWQVHGPTSVVGTLYHAIFDARDIEVLCVFSLAKPLSYARGTFIPFAVSITCSDRQALDLFTARGSLKVQLVRTLQVKSDPVSRPKDVERDVRTRVGIGIYWVSDEDTVSADTKRVRGEIPLTADLKANIAFQHLTVKYHVSLTLTAPGFTPHRSEVGTPLFSRGVTIGSDLPHGPKPISSVPHSRRTEATGPASGS